MNYAVEALQARLRPWTSLRNSANNVLILREQVEKKVGPTMVEKAQKDFDEAVEAIAQIDDAIMKLEDDS